MTVIIERQIARIYIYTKSKNIAKRFCIQKVETFQKAIQLPYVFTYKEHHTLRYAIFHENFECGIYIQKA